MAVSGIIGALIMGFYGSFVELAFQTSDVLLVSAAVMLGTVVLCVVSDRAEVQQTILLGSKMTKNSKTNLDIIRSWVDATKDDYYEAIVDEYVKCLRQAEDTISSKAKLLTVSIFSFVVGLGVFFVGLVMAL